MNEFFDHGFQITTIHRDRPPKVQLGPGPRFFTNIKFGDLALLGKLVVDGTNLNEALDRSGVSWWRAKRFLNSIGLGNIPRQKRMPSGQTHQKVCDICNLPMTVTTRRQKRHQGTCKITYHNKHRLNYPQYHKAGSS